MPLSYEHFNSNEDQLMYDATIADDLRRWVKNYNEKSGLDYVYIEQATGYFSLYRVSDLSETVMLYVTNDHNWFAKYVKSHCEA